MGNKIAKVFTVSGAIAVPTVQLINENGIAVDPTNVHVTNLTNNQYLVVCNVDDNFFGAVQLLDGTTVLNSLEVFPYLSNFLFEQRFNLSVRPYDIRMYSGDDVLFYFFTKGYINIIEIVITIVDANDKQLLVASETNGCEIVNGEPCNDMTLATIAHTNTTVTVSLTSELTKQLQPGYGVHSYSLVITDSVEGVKTISIGSVVFDSSGES